MTKVRIRQVASRTRWQLVTFYGLTGGESPGIVDLVAIRKDHTAPIAGLKRGDALQIILIQVKGGSAAVPTTEDGKRLRTVGKQVHARNLLLATWKRGSVARFFRYNPRATEKRNEWVEVTDLETIFR